MTFCDWSAAIVLEKATIFHRGFNGRRADNMKQTLFDLSFSLLKKNILKNRKWLLQKSKRISKRW